MCNPDCLISPFFVELAWIRLNYFLGRRVSRSSMVDDDVVVVEKIKSTNQPVLEMVETGVYI